MVHPAIANLCATSLRLALQAYPEVWPYLSPATRRGIVKGWVTINGNHVLIGEEDSEGGDSGGESGGADFSPMGDEEQGQWASEQWNKLDTNQRKAVRSYADTEHYKSINDGLRNGETLNKRDQQIASTLDGAMIETDHSMVVYRGIGIDASIASQLQEGATFTDPGFLSTSTNEKLANAFINRMPGKVPYHFTIEVPAGTRVLPLTSRYHNENEVILYRGSSLQIKSVVWKPNPSIGGEYRGSYEILARVVQ